MTKVKATTKHFRQVEIEVTMGIEDVFELASVDDFGPEWSIALQIGGKTFDLAGKPEMRFTLKRWITT